MPDSVNVNKKTVLVLEDEPALLLAFSEAMGELGYNVIPCRRGSLALEELRKRKDEVFALWVDLWLDDWMNGFDFLHLVAGEGLFGGKVVISTGMSDVEKDFADCLNILRWKFSDVRICTKPALIEDIREALYCAAS